jgi:hypothetical protein
MSMVFWMAVGYGIAVLCPFPWLSQAMIDGWKKLGSWISGS